MAPKTKAEPRLQGVLASGAAGPYSAREAWSVEGPPEARRFSAKGEERGERDLLWSMSAGFGLRGAWSSFDLQVTPRDRPSEVTTTAFRCFGGRAFGTTIGPGGVPEKTEAAFPPGSAFRGFSFALDGLVATSQPLRLGHGRRLLVIEVAGDDLQPRIRDWMLLAVSKHRAEDGSGAAWGLAYEFRPADAPGRAQTMLLATASGNVLRASRVSRGGTLEVLPAEGGP
jgi:hypothetical protein